MYKHGYPPPRNHNKRYTRDQLINMAVSQLVRNLREGYLEHKQLTLWKENNNQHDNQEVKENIQ